MMEIIKLNATLLRLFFTDIFWAVLWVIYVAFWIALGLLCIYGLCWHVGYLGLWITEFKQFSDPMEYPMAGFFIIVLSVILFSISSGVYALTMGIINFVTEKIPNYYRSLRAQALGEPEYEED